MLNTLTDTAQTILIVGPHPDDVEFSTGRLILKRKGKNVHVACVTDGRKGQDGAAVKKQLEEDKYATLRINESKKALDEFHIHSDNQYFLALPDQEVVSNPYIIDQLYLFLRKIKPDFLLIPPWEGAHPDHDATHLFCVMAAHHAKFPQEQIYEYASYNNYQGTFHVQTFIPAEKQIFVLHPSPNEQLRWRHIMKIFKSQVNQQQYYIPQSKDEKYRQLPNYDYTKLPYSSTQATIMRDLLGSLGSRLVANKDKLFYETWNNSINPLEIKKALNTHQEHYS